MSAEPPLLKRSWAVGRYTAHLTVQRPKSGAVTNAVIEWTPGPPRDLTSRDRETFRRGRDRALRDLSEMLNGTVAVIEV